jgi:hypothetical protein
MPKADTATVDAPADATTTTELTLLDTIVRDGGMARDADQDRYARNLVGEFATRCSTTASRWGTTRSAPSRSGSSRSTS